MAKTNYKSGAQTVQKYGDTRIDAPVSGIPVADTTTIGVKTPAGVTASVDFTLDSHEDIEAGNAVWVKSTAVGAASTAFIQTEYGPTGVRFTSAGIASEQTVDFGGNVVGGNTTGLVADTTEYTATINIDGTDYLVMVVGSAAQTFTNLITQINTDLPATEASIDGDGNITVTSTATDDTSNVLITDVDLFSSLNDFVVVNDATGSTVTAWIKS